MAELRTTGLRTKDRRFKDRLKINRRNIPVHIVFWAFVLFLLYLFFRAFGG